ncbi:mechanosensitive ion channel [Flavobacteriaceae bacterium]|jgi:miniconductance mechanosensitive channel|uniref:mechanosensitive ion channel family protein n=1 Tax=Candidatus Arcticimaribacter forsetii TaxID=2820661 RepID=UPI002076EFCF|nr:mechanosensitive ion channel domain-containing protein [Candidatus Arcticimaribacter forsetii]MDB2329853.1 mechanosensitive ion channel family protein [Flavobacteriaceae bacterium]MDB4714746.1 mechanosensitive ion channel family protein [Flavobacteriaceae bacterium]MDB4738310.1 mechanosensitive ion channel family protein [Flavobacteriaceae bacterium]MDC0959877.1 mechanosensitive ion channel [Flavobacteriaceae bacterium]
MQSSKIRSLIFDKLSESGLNSNLADIATSSCILLGYLFMSLLLFWISRKLIIGAFTKITKKTKSTFDDILIEHKIPKLLSYFPTLFFLSKVIPTVFENQNWIPRVFEAVTIIVVIALIRSLLKSVRDYLKTLNSFKDKPIDSYIQVVMIFLWFIGGIIILSILTETDIGTFLTTLGALSAVLLFVFKDTILGFVASVQITINDTVRIGDWVSMPNNNADGTVVKISLSTVQIQNFDNTITSIPTYKLISDSFINWRGMSESSGRRIKRSILIKVGSIRFLEDDELNPLKKINLMSGIIQSKEEDIKNYNSKFNADKSLLINGRNLTNIGLFRAYAEAYLKDHPMINKEMTLMCRQLAQTSQGVPIEIYVFSADKKWENYESIVADIFDHLLASTKYFHLECFEFSPIIPKL